MGLEHVLTVCIELKQFVFTQKAVRESRNGGVFGADFNRGNRSGIDVIGARILLIHLYFSFWSLNDKILSRRIRIR